MKNRSLKIQLGLRLALAGFFLFSAQWLGLALTLLMPIFTPWGAALSLTAEDQKEIKSLLTEVGDKHRATIEQEVKAAVNASLVDKDFSERQNKALVEKMEAVGLKADTIKNFQEAIEKQGEALRKLIEKGKEAEETVESIVEKQADAIKRLSENANHKNSANNVIIKLPGKVVEKTQVTRAGVTNTTMAMRLAEVGQLPYLGLQMSQIFRHERVGESSNGVIRFYDQQAITRAAANVSEGNSAPESAITWIERLVKVEKIMDSIPVTAEAWKDVYFIQSEINRLLNINMALKEDQQIWAGSGNTPQILGVYTNAAANFAFDGSGAAYAGKTPFANIYDLIAVARVDIMNSKQSKYAPNIVCMNPIDILNMKLTKDTLGRYVIPPYTTADGRTIDGCVVIESSQVTADTMLVGDSRYNIIYDLDDIEIEMGYINDQFVKDAMTIKASKRMTNLTRNVDADAFRAVTSIAAAVNNITKP